MADRIVVPGALRKAREQRKITLRGLAAKTQMSNGYISDLEAGIKGGSAETHQRLATALGVAVSDITADASTHVRCEHCDGRGLVSIVASVGAVA